MTSEQKVHQKLFPLTFLPLTLLISLTSLTPHLRDGLISLFLPYTLLLPLSSSTLLYPSLCLSEDGSTPSHT